MARNNAPSVVVACAALLAAASAAAAEDAPPDSSPGAVLGVDEIRAALLSAHSSLRRLKATVRSGGARDALPTAINVVAAAGESRYELSWHATYAVPDDDPLAIERFYDGRNWNLFQPYERRYEVSRRFAIPPYIDKVRLSVLFDALAWWPPDDPSEPPRSHGTAVFLQDMISDPRCAVTGLAAVEGGLVCHRVEVPGEFVFWYDAALNVIRRRRDVCHIAHRDTTVTVEYRLMDFCEVAPGIRLPQTIHRRMPHSNVETWHAVAGYAVNDDVPDSQFAFDPPAGTLVYDRDTDTSRQIPGGVDWLSHVAKRVERLSAQSRGVTDHSLPIWYRSAAAFLCGMALYVVIASWRAMSRSRETVTYSVGHRV